MPVKTGESIDIFIEEQAFSPSYDLAHLNPPLPPTSHISKFSLSQSLCMSPVELTGEGGVRGWGRSQIIRRRERLVLYKLFNTL